MIFNLKLIYRCRYSDRFSVSCTKLTPIKIWADIKRYFILSTLITCAAYSHASDSFFPYKSCFEASAKKFNLDANFIAAVASVESSFNPLAESSSGAIGLMQI